MDPRDLLREFSRVIELSARQSGIRDPMWSLDDLIAEGRIAAWRAAQTWDPSRGTLSARVRVAVRHRMSHIRRSSSLPPMVVDHDAEDAAPSPERITAARLLVARLPERRREIARLALAGADGAEIGEALGISRERVRQQLQSIVEAA